jgi:hypothetical protein
LDRRAQLNYNDRFLNGYTANPAQRIYDDERIDAELRVKYQFHKRLAIFATGPMRWIKPSFACRNGTLSAAEDPLQRHALEHWNQWHAVSKCGRCD